MIMRRLTKMFLLGILAVMLTIPVAYAQTGDTGKQVKEAPAEEVSKAPSTDLKVERIACGVGIEEREVQGEAVTFSSDTERIYCWSLITGCEEPTIVEHVWYYGGDEKARVALDVKYPRMRTWSYKTMMPEWKGDWKVEVIDADGNLLASTEFEVE
ncbi:MAG: hypothetical protein B6D58_03410 [candidate division Zixibacteria bacterium 4484_95]|nr:MAG: hypothetical protein B6D58_03410 [candidate division Zixibacteria bacterium 4484_95]RKX19702.1 MAG: hypothetical protein DRP26_02965 [candidate division Zixibacteria bacterium]